MADDEGVSIDIDVDMSISETGERMMTMSEAEALIAKLVDERVAQAIGNKPKPRKPRETPREPPIKEQEEEEEEEEETLTLPRAKRHDHRRTRKRRKADGDNIDPFYSTGGNSHMISVYGIGYPPRKHYREKQPKYLVPGLSGPPEDIPPAEKELTEGSPLTVPGSAFQIRARGFQQAKVARRGPFRDRTSQAAFSHETFEDRLKEIERQLAEGAKARKEISQTINKVQSLIGRGTGEATSMIKSPQDFIGRHVLKLLGGAGPHGAAVVAGIGLALAVPATMERFIKLLSVKGAPWNKDWRRLVEEEVNSLMDVDEKRRRLTGHDLYVVTQQYGYVPETGSEAYNSAENRHETVISKKIGLAEKAYGVN